MTDERTALVGRLDFLRATVINKFVGRQGMTFDLRYALVHMIEETARHCGHLDLLRERIDGQTGE